MEKRNNRWERCLYLVCVFVCLWTPVLSESSDHSRVPRGLRIHRRQLTNRNAQHPTSNDGNNRVIEPIPEGPNVNMPRMSMSEMIRLINQAAIAVDNRLKNLEPNIFNSGIVQQQGTPAWFAAAMGKTKVAAKNFSRPALIAEEATRLVSKNFGLSKEEITFGLPAADIRGTTLSEICPLEVDFPCQPGKYRAYSGYCNNVQNPTWGNANTRYLRYLPPDYADGISIPRVSITGGELPSGREVSLSVHGDSDRPHPHLTSILAIFGEFISHDIAHSAQSAGFHGHRIKCCGVPSDKIHPECLPIRVPENDPAYGRIGMTCMEYTRSCTAPRIACTLGPREQINQVTSFLDGSTIYGSSVEESNILRTFRGGLLKSQRSNNGKELLPADEDNRDCRGGAARKKCFMAGDVRVNENTPLMVMHTLWAREHNRVAKALSTINPHWKDNEVFEEGRRIVGAQIQHVTFNELLPATLGRELMDKFDLQIQSSGHFMGYDINVNAGIANSVGSAVLSFLFSMMPSHFDLVTAQNDQLKKVGTRMMSETSFQPSDLYQGGKFDEYVMGMVSQKAQSRDEFITNEMTNNLFADPKTGLGADMAAMTIQQGRDHGVPSYIQWRKFCRLDPVIETFRDLRSIMTAESVDKLTNIYKEVADIDLFTGGLAEKPIIGAVVGPTFGCLLARQFHYLRKGDRFWYENDIPPSSFTKEQLAELRKSTLARVICNNANGIHFVQPSTFLLSDPFLNAYQSCDTADIPEIDLSKWQTATPVFKVPEEMLEESMVRAKRHLAELRSVEEDSFVNRIGVADNKSPQGTHLGFLRPKRMARIVSNQSMVLELASLGFADVFLNPPSNHFRQKRDREGRRQPNNVHDLMNALPNVDVSDLLDLPKVLDCDDQVLPCDHTSRFRTMTGWCNNLNNPDWGKSIHSFNRIIPARYDDGMTSPRSRSQAGAPLPSPRTVSTAVHYDVSVPHVRYSLMVMQFGQFLDHDLTFTPMNEGFGGTALNCKPCDSTRSVHPECLPIPIPNNDNFYPANDQGNGQPKCLHFVRSMPGQLKLGPREQLNQVTTFLDASNVYGSDNCDGKVLRAFVGGRMNSTRNPSRGTRELLPQTAFHKECRAPSRLCFEAGDNRASEQPALAAMHTVWLREHNRVADGLSRVNSHWNDEQVYQNARRILSSLQQHVTYNEFLPRVLGLNFLNRFGLRLETENYHNGYNQRCNPTMLNEFGSAAFRFGHSLIKPVLERYDRNYKLMTDPLLLRKGFFNSDMLMTTHAIDNIMRGLVTSSMETLDNTITQEVTNHLFEDSRIPFSGMDLASLNLQRGRDHGLAPYNDYRQACNLTRARTFDDLNNEIPRNLVERLNNVYENVNDIDLFTGGLIETPLHGGLVGPTFGCILGIQFQMLRTCDRFWYETGNPLVRFTEAQLASIRKMSLAKIICDNSDTVDTIQRSAMDLPDPFLNPRVACNSLPGLNLDLFKERVTCTVDRITIDVGNAERISPCVMCTCTKEGPICQSLKINNCFHLASTFSKEAILKDDVCKVQCAFSFRAFPQVDISSNNVLGFSNN